MGKHRILVINPGSTSTKIALFEDTQELFNDTLRHSSEEIHSFARVADQFAFRKEIILHSLREAGISIDSLSAVIGRGGLVKPIASGVYCVNEALKQDLIHPPQGEHASNLGGLLAADIAASVTGAQAYIADPVVVDEMSEVARITGWPQCRRLSIFHALNQKAVARAYSMQCGKPYETLNLIVAHLGGGISVGAHEKGKVVDVNNALDGEGPFSPERAGTLPAGELAALCFSGKYTQKEIQKMLNGEGGVVALLHTNDTRIALKRAEEGDAEARLVMEALCYNVSKSIGASAAVLAGKVDAILITGGIAYSNYVCEEIERRVAFLAPVHRFPGEDEMQALAENALMAITGQVEAKIYR